MSVFISHSTDDRQAFNDVIEALKVAKIPCWSSKKLAAGEPLRDRLRQAIDDCSVCVFIATPKSLRSEWCSAEIGAFWGSRKPVIIYKADERVTAAPKPYQADKWAMTLEELVSGARVHVDRARGLSFRRDSPASIFWLGHDLARAARLVLFERDQEEEIELNLLCALHHLAASGLEARDARRKLLGALAECRRVAKMSASAKGQLADTIVNAQNEIGNRFERVQDGFRGYPLEEEREAFRRESLRSKATPASTARGSNRARGLRARP